MSDPQAGPDEPDAPEDLALPTDFWAAPLPPEVVATGADGTLAPEAEEPVAWSDPEPADLTGSWFWADDAPEAPTPDDTGDVVIGPDWWEGADDLEAPLPDDLVLPPAPTDEPAPPPLSLAVLPGPEERADGGPEDLGEDLLFAPAWGDEPETGLADDLTLPAAAVDAPDPLPSAVLPDPFAAHPGSEEAGEDLFFAPAWADDGEEPLTGLTEPADDLTLAPDSVDEPDPVDEPEPVTLAVLPGARPEAHPGPGRWDRWREHRPGARATAAAVVGLVLGLSVLVGVLSRSDTSSNDMVQSGPTTLPPAPQRSAPTTQVPTLQASPVDVTAPPTDAPATDAPATDAVAGPVQAGGGSNPLPAAGAPARATGAPAAPPVAGPRPAGGPSPRPAAAPAPAAASANPAPAAADSPSWQDQPEPTVSRRTSRTTVPPVTAAPPPPDTTAPPADDGDQLPCFEQIRHGRLACS